jgi:hypothetical protein
MPTLLLGSIWAAVTAAAVLAAKKPAVAARELVATSVEITLRCCGWSLP